MSKLKQLADDMREIESKMKKEGEKSMKEAFKEFFSSHPEVTSIVWTQFTPYFMDGGPCVFSVNDFELKCDLSFFPEKESDKIKKELCKYHDEDELDDYHYGDVNFARELEKCKNTLTHNQKKIISDFDELTSALHNLDSILEMVFGDHCMVRATPKGFDVSDYEHD